MRRLLIPALLISLSASAGAQDARDRVLDARRTLDAGHPDSLLAARAALDLAGRLANADPGGVAGDDREAAGWAAYYGALADYRLSMHFWQADPERAGRHTDAGLDALRALVRQRGASDAVRAEAYALLSGLTGNRIGLEPGLAPQLGADVRAHADRALALAPENPRAVLFDAVALQTTPPEWGGDPERAGERLAEAVRLFEAEPASGADDPAPRWGLADAHGWVGMGHLMAGRTAEARGAIEAGLAADPRSAFVGGLVPWLEGAEAQAASGQDRP